MESMPSFTNEIIVDAVNVGSFLGPLAQPYAYKDELRKVIDSLYQAACRSANRYFVLEGEIVRAAQSTKLGAREYMNESRVLVHVDIPDPTHEQIERARQAWAHFPYRKCFIALKHGEEMQIILKPTAHYAGKLAREGWTVRELTRG